jgi:hypothetical protein
MQKKKTRRSARTTLTSVKREMLEPRLTESVRDALRNEPALVAEKPSAFSPKV